MGWVIWGGAVVAVAGLVGVYIGVYRPRQLRWGATDGEVAREMPGDEIVARPVFNATRAVTVNARPEDIWPWLVQIGFGRAGWYSYDILDNLGRHSSEQILPEYQTLEPGDLIPFGTWRGFRSIRERDPPQRIDGLVGAQETVHNVGLGAVSRGW